MTNYRLIMLLSFGHFVTDINQGALAAILPFFISEYHLTYAAGASIIFAANSASVIVQPIFGYVADRLNRPWLIPIAFLAAGIGLAFTGLAKDFSMIILLSIISGIGIAAFHPQAARLVNFAAGANKGTSMSFFGLGGTIGFAVGPIIATSVLVTIGLKGTLFFAIPVTIAAVIFFGQLPGLNRLEKGAGITKVDHQATFRNDSWFAFSLLSLIIIGRSVMFYSLNTFIPLYWTGYFNESIAKGGVALSTIAASGVFGNIAGGWISDRIGFKKMIIAGFLCLVIFLPLLISTDQPMIALFLLIPIGFTLSATYSPTIVLGQEYLPNHVGFSSGITLGISVAFGGIAAPFVGMIADNYGIWTALSTIAFLPLPVVLLSLFLPSPKADNTIIKN